MTEGNQRDENFEQLTNLSDKDIEQLWNHEALRRNAELDSGSASMRDAGDVLEMQDRISEKAVTLQQNQPAIIQTKCCTVT
jgi:hypothetical protein